MQTMSPELAKMCDLLELVYRDNDGAIAAVGMTLSLAMDAAALRLGRMPTDGEVAEVIAEAVRNNLRILVAMQAKHGGSHDTTH